MTDSHGSTFQTKYVIRMNIKLAQVSVFIVRSHLGWGQERSILYKGVETSP